MTDADVQGETWVTRAPGSGRGYWKVIAVDVYMSIIRTVAERLSEGDAARICVAHNSPDPFRIADHEAARVYREALEQARRLADDLTTQAYESTVLGGVFFDSLSALRAVLDAAKREG